MAYSGHLNGHGREGRTGLTTQTNARSPANENGKMTRDVVLAAAREIIEETEPRHCPCADRAAPSGGTGPPLSSHGSAAGEVRLGGHRSRWIERDNRGVCPSVRQRLAGTASACEKKEIRAPC